MIALSSQKSFRYDITAGGDVQNMVVTWLNWLLLSYVITGEIQKTVSS